MGVCVRVWITSGIAAIAAGTRAETPWRVRPLADDYVVVCESHSPSNVYCYTPGLAVAARGRLVATMDFGGSGWKKGEPRGRIFVSDDRGKSWAQRASFPFGHARPFVAGASLYVLGQAGDLMVVRSDDNGETWSEPARLTDKQHWHQSACNVWTANGCVYLVMERRVTQAIQSWPVGELAPVLLRGRLDADLTRRENWTFASELSFHDTVPNIEKGLPLIFSVCRSMTPPIRAARCRRRAAKARRSAGWKPM